ncbi:hypothetical protein B0T09DRAFT_409916 [Sordaria sp. MPI-SDFR-AT-0083]|nr:hypothetical protein B0T09DRAFT_409916 [Sordaria sp. MPI-SDFR-AT-0083]
MPPTDPWTTSKGTMPGRNWHIPRVSQNSSGTKTWTLNSRLSQPDRTTEERNPTEESAKTARYAVSTKEQPKTPLSRGGTWERTPIQTFSSTIPPHRVLKPIATLSGYKTLESASGSLSLRYAVVRAGPHEERTNHDEFKGDSCPGVRATNRRTNREYNVTMVDDEICTR